MRVVDLSADFRLHEPGRLRGLVRRARGARDWWGARCTGCRSCTASEIAGADLVANPGCYPTAAILALAPLARADLLGDVVIDAKSGVSGAGREPTHDKHFVSVDETVTPYKVGRHRHTPEIEQELGNGVLVTFTPHLVPVAHGELVSCYVTPTRAEDVAALYEMYDGRAVGRGRRRARPGCSRCARRTSAASRCTSDERTGRIIVFATIDNLWKGTSSQAVQNLNLMFGRDESEGL